MLFSSYKNFYFYSECRENYCNPTSRRLKKKETAETFHCVKWCGNFYTTFKFFFFITFASPCILKKEVVSHDGTCRAIWEISDVTLIRSRLTKQGTRSNVIDAYECIREHCTPSPLGEHFNHRCGQQRWHQCCYTQREGARGREGESKNENRWNGTKYKLRGKKNYSVRWCKRRFAFQFDMYRTFLTRTLLWLFHVFSRGISNRFLNSYDPFDFFFLCFLLSADLLN